jgi:ribosomal protein L37E
MNLLSFRTPVLYAACHRCGNALTHGEEECPHCGTNQSRALRAPNSVDFNNSNVMMMPGRMLVPYPSVPEEVDTAMNIARERARVARRVAFGVAGGGLLAVALALTYAPGLRSPAVQRLAALPEPARTPAFVPVAPDNAPKAAAPASTTTVIAAAKPANPVSVTAAKTPAVNLASIPAATYAAAPAPTQTPTPAPMPAPTLTPALESSDRDDCVDHEEADNDFRCCAAGRRSQRSRWVLKTGPVTTGDAERTAPDNRNHSNNSNDNGERDQRAKPGGCARIEEPELTRQLSRSRRMTQRPRHPSRSRKTPRHRQ